MNVDIDHSDRRTPVQKTGDGHSPDRYPPATFCRIAGNISRRSFAIERTGARGRSQQDAPHGGWLVRVLINPRIGGPLSELSGRAADIAGMTAFDPGQ